MADFPRQGEVFFIRLPDEDKERPAPTHVELLAGEGGLPRTSCARCENVTTLAKSLLTRGPLGHPVSAARMQDVVLAVMRALGHIQT